ncbi:uncharacterized protein [Paramormyrops kingsleyae]|uniref:uncharacterized protein n=1 Tax=Paramormyrops kingsleyae TaxID=1676925 RepID=UPI003B96F33C
MVSISMVGPNVNWKFLELLQQEQMEQFGGSQLAVVGSCGLHTLHNAFKHGFAKWQIDKLLKALHSLFNCAPARREDFCCVTKSSTFPLHFCGHRWLENLPVVERAVEIWPSMETYVDAVKSKKIPNPGSSSFDTIAASREDPLILPKLHFFMAMSRTFQPFLEKYQTDQPVMPFLHKDLTELLKSLLRRFVKKELLDVSVVKLARLDATDVQTWVPPKDVDIGIGASSVLKALLQSKSSRVGELAVMMFRKDCITCLSNIVQKVQERSPLKYPLVRYTSCLNPNQMNSNPDMCQKYMTHLVEKFLENKQLPGGISAGDAITQQFGSLLYKAKDESFVSFCPMNQRLDEFLHGVICGSYNELWSFCKKVLLLSHGQATVERGFSVNKEVETWNMKEDTVVAHRLICDYVRVSGGILNVPLSKELLNAAKSARSRYRLHLDEERKRKANELQCQKRKAAEEDIQQLKKKKKTLADVCSSLEKDADLYAEEAERKSISQMAQLISKSNALRRRLKDKQKEKEDLEEEIAKKVVKLGHINAFDAKH